MYQGHPCAHFSLKMHTHTHKFNNVIFPKGNFGSLVKTAWESRSLGWDFSLTIPNVVAAFGEAVISLADGSAMESKSFCMTQSNSKVSSWERIYYWKLNYIRCLRTGNKHRLMSLNLACHKHTVRNKPRKQF